MHWARSIGLGLLVLLVVIQVVPYGRSHTNPPVTAEPGWDVPETRELAVRACFDCHSNETAWPWYTNVAPVLVQRDVDRGRAALNLSESARPAEEADEAAETVREGEMPPRPYTLIHPDARLTDGELQRLAAGLAATLGRDGGSGDEDDGDDEHGEGDD
jgi:hypothetical protein